jgi:hypothetical protein
MHDQTAEGLRRFCGSNVSDSCLRQQRQHTTVTSDPLRISSDSFSNFTESHARSIPVCKLHSGFL